MYKYMPVVKQYINGMQNYEIKKTRRTKIHKNKKE